MQGSEKMEENAKKERAPKKNILKNLNAEFHKIVWPDQKELVKNTTAVLAIGIGLGIVIALLDFVLKSGLGLIIK